MRARRRGAAQARDEVVEAPEAGRRLPRRARRRAAADRRPLVALRQVPEPQAVGAQRVVELGEPPPGLHARRARVRVDVEHRVQAAEVERHRRVPAPAHRRDAADDARAAPERDHRRALLRACVQHGLDLLVGGRRDDHVRRVLGRSRAQRQQVEVGLAGRAQHAGLRVVAHVLGADRPLQGRPERRADDRRAQAHVLQRDGPGHDGPRDAEPLAQEPGRVVGERGARARLAPAPELLLAAHGSTARAMPASASSSWRRPARRSRKRPKCAQPRGDWRSSSVSSRPVGGGRQPRLGHRRAEHALERRAGHRERPAPQPLGLGRLKALVGAHPAAALLGEHRRPAPLADRLHPPDERPPARQRVGIREHAPDRRAPARAGSACGRCASAAASPRRT